MTFWGFAPDQMVDDDESGLIGCIVMVEFHRVFNVTLNAGNPAFQSRVMPSYY